MWDFDYRKDMCRTKGRDILYRSCDWIAAIDGPTFCFVCSDISALFLGQEALAISGSLGGSCVHEKAFRAKIIQI